MAGKKSTAPLKDYGSGNGKERSDSEDLPLSEMKSTQSGD